MCVFSLLCALALSFFDKRADRILKRSSVASGSYQYLAELVPINLAIRENLIFCVNS